MGLFDFFRPKWKHSDAEVRQEAVRRLHEDDVRVLSQVARHDEDVRVRRIAVKKLQDARLLGEIAGSDPDEGLRRMAQEKATDLAIEDAVSGDEKLARAGLGQLTAQRALAVVARRAERVEVREEALARLTDPKALLELARGGEDPQLRRRAAERIEDPQALRDLALAAPDREVALRAVERLGDPELLLDVAQRGRSKAIRAAAAARLPEGALAAGRVGGRSAASEAGNEKRQRRERMHKLCQRVEAAARSTDFERAHKEIDEARAAWGELAAGDLPNEGNSGEQELQRRFVRACEEFRIRREVYRQKLHLEAEKEALRAQRAEEERKGQESARERAVLCERVEALVNPAAGTEGMPSQIEEARAAWAALPPMNPVPEELGRRFARACEDALRHHKHAQALAAKRHELLMLVENVEGLPARERGPHFRTLEKKWHDLAAALPGNDELQVRFARLREQVQAAREEEKARRAAEEAELLGRLEEQCHKLEALAETDSLKKADQALKDARLAFEALASSRAPREKQPELKARLEAARDKLRLRIQELRDVESWRRFANLPKLEELCKLAEGLADEKDLPKAAKILRLLESEWKKIGAGPKEKTDALWQRFHGACEKLRERLQAHFAALDAERAENLKKKEGLCQKAEAIADAHTADSEGRDLKEGAEALKKLQKEWKAIGPVPRAHSDAVWKRFRAACDRLFERRQAQQLEDVEELKKNLMLKEELCRKAEALVGATEWEDGTDWKAATEQIKRYQAEWKAAGPVPRDQAEALWKRFRESCDRFFERRKAHYDKVDEERTKNLRAKEELCQRVEAIAEPEEDPLELVKRFMDEWKEIGPAPKDRSDAVWHRFQAAMKRLKELRFHVPQLENDHSRFENRLPLQGIVEKLRSAADDGEPPKS